MMNESQRNRVRQLKSIGGWAVCLVTFLSLNIVASAQERQELRRSYALNPGATVSLENISGDITISSWEEPRAEVVAVKVGPADQLDEVEISIDAQPSALDIRTIYPRCENCNVNVSVRYSLKVPREVNLDTIKSISGDIRISDITGRVAARSVSGSVRASRVGQEVELQTVSGDAKVTRAGGRASLQSVSGDIHADSVAGELRANTVSGDIDIRGPAADIRAESVSGDIEVALPPESSFNLRASSFSGSIDTDFELSKLRYSDENKLSGSIGEGGPWLTLSTHSGRIRVRRSRSSL